MRPWNTDPPEEVQKIATSYSRWMGLDPDLQRLTPAVLSKGDGGAPLGRAFVAKPTRLYSAKHNQVKVNVGKPHNSSFLCFLQCSVEC